MTDLTHQEISDVLFLKKFFLYQEEACSFVFVFFGGGEGGVVAVFWEIWELKSKRLQITKISLVKGSLLHVVQSMDIGARVSTEPSA